MLIVVTIVGILVTIAGFVALAIDKRQRERASRGSR